MLNKNKKKILLFFAQNKQFKDATFGIWKVIGVFLYFLVW